MVAGRPREGHGGERPGGELIGCDPVHDGNDQVRNISEQRRRPLAAGAHDGLRRIDHRLVQASAKAGCRIELAVVVIDISQGAENHVDLAQLFYVDVAQGCIGLIRRQQADLQCGEDGRIEQIADRYMAAAHAAQHQDRRLRILGRTVALEAYAARQVVAQRVGLLRPTQHVQDQG